MSTYMQGTCRSFVGALVNKDQRVPEKILVWVANADCLVENNFFPLSLTTSSGQNAQIQAETTCWSQQVCLPLDLMHVP